MQGRGVELHRLLIKARKRHGVRVDMPIDGQVGPTMCIVIPGFDGSNMIINGLV